MNRSPEDDVEVILPPGPGQFDMNDMAQELDQDEFDGPVSNGKFLDTTLVSSEFMSTQQEPIVASKSQSMSQSPNQSWFPMSREKKTRIKNKKQRFLF